MIQMILFDDSIIEIREYYVTRHDIIQDSLGNRRKRRASLGLFYPDMIWIRDSNSPCRETKIN